MKQAVEISADVAKILANQLAKISFLEIQKTISETFGTKAPLYKDNNRKVFRDIIDLIKYNIS